MKSDQPTDVEEVIETEGKVISIHLLELIVLMISLGGLKLKISTFDGKNDPDAFLEWGRMIELVFDCQNFSDLKKVRLAATEFSGYAINWYYQVVTHRRRTSERPIETWDELTMLMRRRFVPTHYHRELYQKLRRLLQGTKLISLKLP